MRGAPNCARSIERVDLGMIERRDRILPDQLFGRHVRADMARDRTHVRGL